MNRMRSLLVLLSLGVLASALSIAPAAALCTTNGRSCGASTSANDRLCCPGSICGPWGNVCQPGCRIGGIAYRASAINPANPCQICLPNRSTKAWSNLADATVCDDGNACSLTSACHGGICAGSNWVLCNGSFETGDFTGWTALDLVSPYRELHVGGAGEESPAFPSFTTAPTDGTYAAIDGFDGGGPGSIELSQFLTVPVVPTTLRFDYRAGWDMGPYGATLPRVFGVRIRSAADQSVLSDATLLTANPGENINDTGPLSGSIDLSPWAGQTIIINFYQDVPEFFTGPGLFQLDNVRLTQP